jgi:cobalt/nickel transport system permease protein
MSSMAFSVEWLFGATAPVSFDAVFAAMVGVHVLIGAGEAIISATAVGAVLASRADLVSGAADLNRRQLGDRRRVRTRTFAIAALMVSLVFAAIVSQFAIDDPDGLEQVAEDTGFAESGSEHALADSIFADYATSGVGNEPLSLAIAGAVGTLVTLAVASGIFIGVRERRSRDPATV